MDRGWIDRLVEALGERYKAQVGTEAAVIEYRRGKAEFRPSRFEVVGDHTLRVTVDVRIPKHAEVEEAEGLVNALEKGTMSRRGFEKASDETLAMTSEAGEAAGSARTLVFTAEHDDVEVAAKHLRAIVESVDIPLIVGIHDPPDCIAKDPMKPPPKPKVAAGEELEPLRFRLASGLLHDLSVMVDQNTRVLRVMERKGVSSKQVGDDLKLAHVGRLATRTEGGKVELLAFDRDGEVRVIASSKDSDEFRATAERLAKGVRIPFGAP